MTNSVLLVEELDRATVLLTLNRPDRRNALTIELMEAFCLTMDRLAAEPRYRAVILAGAGPAFCAGLDLIEATDINLAQCSAQWVARVLATVKDSSLVTVAAAQGSAFGGGAGLLACCDFVVASENLRLCFPETRRGLVPALVTAVLRTRLRESDLRELLLLAESIDVQRALSMGLVQRIVSNETLLVDARSIAATILKGAPDAVRLTKLWLRDAATVSAASLFERALQLHQQNRCSAEAQEGMAAFQEHREPNWSDVVEV